MLNSPSVMTADSTLLLLAALSNLCLLSGRTCETLYKRNVIVTLVKCARDTRKATLLVLEQVTTVLYSASLHSAH